MPWFQKKQSKDSSDFSSNAEALLRKLEAEYSCHPRHGDYTHPIEVADDLARDGRYDESLAAYEQILQLDPNNITVCHHKGDLLADLIEAV
jgi:tetratricopeptide (TPR) repeat protein